MPAEIPHMPHQGVHRPGPSYRHPDQETVADMPTTEPWGEPIRPLPHGGLRTGERAGSSANTRPLVELLRMANHTRSVRAIWKLHFRLVSANPGPYLALGGIVCLAGVLGWLAESMLSVGTPISPDVLAVAHVLTLLVAAGITSLALLPLFRSAARDTSGRRSHLLWALAGIPWVPAVTACLVQAAWALVPLQLLAESGTVVTSQASSTETTLPAIIYVMAASTWIHVQAIASVYVLPAIFCDRLTFFEAVGRQWRVLRASPWYTLKLATLCWLLIAAPLMVCAPPLYLLAVPAVVTCATLGYRARMGSLAENPFFTITNEAQDSDSDSGRSQQESTERIPEPYATPTSSFAPPPGWVPPSHRGSN